MQVKGLGHGVLEIGAGDGFSCALATVSDPTYVEVAEVRCWGHDAAGELGDGTTTNSSVPVTNPAQITHVAKFHLMAGGHDACIQTSLGLTCWGDNTNGTLGSGSTAAYSASPVRVSSSAFFGTQASVGAEHVCAAASGASGQLWCWGANAHGQLGVDPTVTASSNVPVATGLTNVTSIAAGLGVHPLTGAPETVQPS